MTTTTTTNEVDRHLRQHRAAVSLNSAATSDYDATPLQTLNACTAAVAMF